MFISYCVSVATLRTERPTDPYALLDDVSLCSKAVIGLLIASSVYWTWRLREKLSDSGPRAPQEILRLWFAWGLLGIAPTVIFFAAIYKSTVVMPSRFVERLNKSLAHYHVAYSAQV